MSDKQRQKWQLINKSQRLQGSTRRLTYYQTQLNMENVYVQDL